MPAGPERWAEVQRCFHIASELAPDLRNEYLRRACSDDDLRTEVEALLLWSDQAAEAFETPAIEMAAMNIAARDTEPLPGEILDRYRIVSRLGSGGMGVVYQAEDTRLRRVIALKFLLPGFAEDNLSLERLRTEAHILSALNHPNICAVYDICEAEGRSFIAMEYVSGRRLDQMIREAPIAPDKALRYAVQIAAGLAKAHTAGIVHRDLKPGNIMVTDDDQIKLLDFGIAKLTRRNAGTGVDAATVTLTQIGTVFGTAAYMSPEQAEGKTVDARSDVFAFGAVLYEMITGRRAFEGESTIATLAAILRAEPELMRRTSPLVPAELDRIVSRCMRKDPAQRYQTAVDLKEALQEMGEEPAPVNRRRYVALLALCLLLAGGVAAYRFRPKTYGPIPADKRIAVLLFRNVGGDPANQALCDGLEEEVSNSLTRLEQFNGALVVVPASDVLKGRIDSARAAGKSLGANLALTGSVERRADGAVHVLINLVDTQTVTQLRTESIDTRASDLANLQDGVMEKVARMLEFVLKPEAARAAKVGNTQSPAAYADYIKGLGYLRRYDRPENIDAAIASFTRAVDIDSRYVLAFAGMAEAYWRRYEALKDVRSIDLALEYSSRALALNDGLAPVHITMGIIRAGKGQYELAETEFRTALKLDPLNGQAWLELANVCDVTGRHDLAQSSFRRAVELRNDDWETLHTLGLSYFRKAQYQEAESYFLQVAQLRPDSAKAYSNLGGLYLKMGRLEDASVQLEKSIAIEPTGAGWSNLGASYYFSGRYPEAIVPFEKATELTAADSILWGNLADAYRWSPTQSDKSAKTYRHALELIRKEIDVNPRDPQLRAREGTYYAALGDERHAVSDIERAIALAPEDAAVRFRAALVYEEAGRRDQALHAIGLALAGGYNRQEIDHAPPLKRLRADRRFRSIVEHSGR